MRTCLIFSPLTCSKSFQYKFLFIIFWVWPPMLIIYITSNHTCKCTCMYMYMYVPYTPPTLLAISLSIFESICCEPCMNSLYVNSSTEMRWDIHVADIDSLTVFLNFVISEDKCWTPLRPRKVSSLERCPLFRGVITANLGLAEVFSLDMRPHSRGVSSLEKCVLIWGVSSFKSYSHLRGIFIREVSSFERWPHLRGVFIKEVSFERCLH